MGFILDVDLETSEGPSHEVYVRVESLTFNKVTMEVGFQLTYWESKEYAEKFDRVTTDQKPNNCIGLIQERVIHFKDDESDGDEILFPHHLRTAITKLQITEIPIFETKKEEVEVPYVSFDENGEEITKYRTIVKEEEVQVGVENIEKEVFDYSALNNLFEFAYNHAKKVLGELIPEDKILIE
jgi:hypothetical protein